jgi:dienelactone hydrolase
MTAASISFPLWSASRPQRLFFLSDQDGSTQGWSVDRAGGEPVRLTAQAVGVESLVVLPDGSGAAWWSDDTGSEHGRWVVTDSVSGTTVDLAPGKSAGWSQGLSMAASVVALAVASDNGYQILLGHRGSELREVFDSKRPAGIGRVWEQTPGGLSADGTLLCFWNCDRGDILHVGLRVIRTSHDEQAEVVGELFDAGLTLAVADWSPLTGDYRLALVHERDGIERPAVWDLTTGSRRDYPLGLPGPVSVAGWWPDATALLIVHTHLGHSQLYRLDLASGQTALVHDPHGWISGAGVRPDGQVWLREESAVRAPRVRTTDGAVVLAAAGEPPAGGRPHESVVFAGPGGDTHLLLTRPDGPAPYPAVLLVHGGPEWTYPDDLDSWEQALADNGYAVVKVNYRGSTGGTVAWRTALHGGNIGFPEVEDVVAGLDNLVARGVVDPRRVAVEGWSWGGYVSLLAAGTHPDRFAAVVAGIPVCDSVMAHRDCSPPQQAYDLAIMGGGPDELADLYAQRSPITYVDQVRAPVLIIAGEHDSACPVRQVRHYVDALEARSANVELDVYGTGHHINSVEAKVRTAEMTLAFLHKHLSGRLPA